MTVHDELFALQHRIAKHKLQKLEIIKEIKNQKNDMLKEKTKLTEEDTKHLDEEMEISLQKDIIKLYEVNYKYYK